MQEKNFQSISHRILYAYRFAFSEFYPVESDIAGIQDQKALHVLMRDILDCLYQEPQLLGLPLDADHAYPWELCSNRIPEWNSIYLAVNKILYNFYRFLFILSLYGEVAGDSLHISIQLLKEQKTVYKQVYSRLFTMVGIDINTEKDRIILTGEGKQGVFHALQLLGSRNQQINDRFRNDHPSVNTYHNLFCFAACGSDVNLDYLLNRVDELYEMNGRLLELKKVCEEKGYKICYTGRCSPTDYNLCIEMKNRVGGFRIEYNSRKEWKIGFGTMNGIGEKAILEDFCTLDEDMQDYFVGICRPCNGCLGCTKGGKNNKFTVNVIYRDKKVELCPMFPQHTWEKIDMRLIDCLFKYHELQEKYADMYSLLVNDYKNKCK